MYIFNPSLFAVLQISRTGSVKKFLDYCRGLSTGCTELSTPRVPRWGSKFLSVSRRVSCSLWENMSVRGM
jgi:hypothetical protein